MPSSAAPRPGVTLTPCQRCGGNLAWQRYGIDFELACLACGRAAANWQRPPPKPSGRPEPPPAQCQAPNTRGRGRCALPADETGYCPRHAKAANTPPPNPPPPSAADIIARSKLMSAAANAKPKCASQHCRRPALPGQTNCSQCRRLANARQLRYLRRRRQETLAAAGQLPLPI